ncbi:Nn.00g051240.m01.CDS01 [Neocucurbitaria sp. VM-36]
MSGPSFSQQNAPHETPPLVAGEKRPQHPQSRVRRRNRLITSCLECRRRKLKCDKGNPCANCTKISRQCVFIASGFDADAQARLAEVKEKMGILERSLEEGIARKTQSKSGTSSAPLKLPGQEESYSDREEEADTKDLDPSLFAIEDAAYYEDENNDDVVDLGIAMGKVRITERIGGLVRPRFSEELAQALKELPKSAPSDSIPISEQDPQSWLGPSRDYVAPSSSFFFAPGVEKTSLMTHLPSKTLVDKLIAHYWIAVHVIARTVHRPSFERQYELFWANVNTGIEPRNSFQAVIFAALLSSVVSMPEDKVLTEFGVDKKSLVDNFREGTEAALARANFLRTTKLETLQAFVMYLIPLCRNEVSRAHSALTGTLIRLAECMGLHRDPTTYSTSPIEIHIRRLVWYQICFLDLRTAEATGPRPQIRPDDYDTRFPLNIDDDDLDRAENGESGVDVRKDRKYFTDMTITRMRFECYEMHRFLWNERPKLELKGADSERKVTITSLLLRVQSFKAAMEKTYVPMLSKNTPLHALASEIYGIISDRLYILLLQKYLSSDRSKMPDRLRQVIMSAAVMILEHSMTIEQQPALSSWSWYIGALHQYHVTLLLLNELYAGSREPAFEQRIWRCLDFAFELPSGLSNLEKVRMVLEDLVGKTQIYASMKRVRVPKHMPHAGPRTHTPGYQARQQERERSGSLQSTPSSASATSFGVGGSLVGQQTLLQQQQPQPFQWQQSQSQVIPFPGSIPNVDWGTIDLPASAANFQLPQQPMSSEETFNRGDSFPTTSTGSLMPSMGHRHGSDASSPRAAIYGSMPAGTENSSPMDALNDIDCNDIEQMFGGAEVGAGSMLIPPFTFPQFSASDLQWPTQDGL